MSSDLRAKFQLDFAVGSAEPLQRVEAVLSRIDETLARMQRAANPFDEFTQPVARATQATQRLNETLTRTTGVTEAVTESATALNETLTRTTGAAEAATEGVTGLNEALNETGASAATATTGIGKIGVEAEEAATQGVTAMERLQAAVSRVRSGAGSYTGGVKNAGQGFHDAVQQGMGSAFGAAAAGFGVLAPVHAAAEYDNDLTHIGIGLDLHGAANQQFIADYGRKLDALARQTGQASPELVAAAAFLGREGYTGARLDAVLPTIARISTAYNSKPKDVAQSAFSIHEGLKISDSNLQQGLASMAVAGKVADMPMEELSSMFPQVVSQAAAFGVNGQTGLNNLLSGLAIVRKNTGSLGTAVADLGQLLVVPQSTAGVKNFAKLGIDINALKERTLKAGGDPFQMLLEVIDRVTNHTKNSRAMQTLFHNVQDRATAAAIIQHWHGDPAHGDYGYTDVQKKLQEATPKVISQDFDTGLQSPLIRVQAFEDALGQMERRIGTAFVPVLNVGTKALHLMTRGFDWLNKNLHGTGSILVTVVGGVLGLTAALGALGAVMIPLKAGLTLVNALTGGWLLKIARLPLLVTSLGPVGIAIAAVAATVTAGYLAWKNWDKIKPMLTSLGNWISGWAQWLGHILMQPLHAMDEWFASTKIGHAMDSWLAHPSAPSTVPAGMPAGSGAQFGLHVTHDPGLAVRQTSGPRGSVSIAPDRGRMVNNP